MNRVIPRLVGIVLLAACTPTTADTTTTAPTTSSTTPTTITSTTEVPTTAIQNTTTLAPLDTTTTLPALPEPRHSLEHGGEAWAVYVAVSEDPDDPNLTEASLLLQDLGYPSGSGDLGCDLGAAEALGVDPEVMHSAVAVYFDTEDDASRFVSGLEARGHQAAGIGLVATYCMD